ncbi:hypothetical protein PR202_gb13756 [Eleusine coracana subsp. coracana]|uniref:RING-type domain-containing protein n=1 Tax=Eleusine coracana subsp. coracana TaxID=191504 RepID=A0AAV5EUI0_ELECO|nr:hypothetical protein QOZ80_9BG0718910 [Eleusine coracana subsp. coracana]GJN25870.1 hypothetical protein PR202_gb13756 [Eleusine coracana subsp. coracana]
MSSDPYEHRRRHGSGVVSAVSTSWQLKVVIVFVLVMPTIALLIIFIRSCLRNLKAVPPPDLHRGRATPEDGGRAPPPAPETVEMAVRSSVGPLVCTYRRADGWSREATCGVCLSELVDGEAVRVLPACMHYFHDSCVHEWLQARATCPLCRASTSSATYIYSV